MPGAPTAADGDNHNFGISKHNVFGVRGGMGLPADELPSETPIEDLGVFIDRLLERIGTTEKLDDDIMESLRVLEWDVSEDELMAVGFKPKKLLAALTQGPAITLQDPRTSWVSSWRSPLAAVPDGVSSPPTAARSRILDRLD